MLKAFTTLPKFGDFFPFKKQTSKVTKEDFVRGSLLKKRMMSAFSPISNENFTKYREFYNKFSEEKKLERSTSLERLIDENDLYDEEIKINDISKKKVVKKRKSSLKNVLDKEKARLFLEEIKTENNKQKVVKMQQFVEKYERKHSDIFNENKMTKDEIRNFGPWEDFWEDKAKLIQKDSNYGHFPSYKLRSIIIKGGDDLRQELIAMQIMHKMKEIFKSSGSNLYLYPYDIIVTSEDSGIIGLLN